MSVFVTELNGIRAHIFYADSLAAAKRCAKAKLQVCGHYPRLEIDGKPIWDGKDESIVTRKADPYDSALFHNAYIEAIQQDTEYDDGGEINDWFYVLPYPVILNEEKPIVWRDDAPPAGAQHRHRRGRKNKSEGV
jgi:hypothetical protein